MKRRERSKTLISPTIRFIPTTSITHTSAHIHIIIYKSPSTHTVIVRLNRNSAGTFSIWSAAFPCRTTQWNGTNTLKFALFVRYIMQYSFSLCSKKVAHRFGFKGNFHPQHRNVVHTFVWTNYVAMVHRKTHTYMATSKCTGNIHAVHGTHTHNQHKAKSTSSCYAASKHVCLQIVIKRCCCQVEKDSSFNAGTNKHGISRYTQIRAHVEHAMNNVVENNTLRINGIRNPQRADTVQYVQSGFWLYRR